MGAPVALARDHGGMMSRTRPLATLALLITISLLTACGDGLGGESASSTSATDGTAPPRAGGAALDWDGVRYDFGRITGMSSNDPQHQVAFITFDRYQLYDQVGTLQSAPDFTEEPIVVGNSDVPWVSENPKERTYALDPDAEVLNLANPGKIQCGGNDKTERPAWKSSTVDDLFAAGIPDSDQVSLTFSDAGKVTRIRISQGC